LLLPPDLGRGKILGARSRKPGESSNSGLLRCVIETFGNAWTASLEQEVNVSSKVLLACLAVLAAAQPLAAQGLPRTYTDGKRALISRGPDEVPPVPDVMTLKDGRRLEAYFLATYRHKVVYYLRVDERLLSFPARGQTYRHRVDRKVAPAQILAQSPDRLRDIHGSAAPPEPVGILEAVTNTRRTTPARLFEGVDYSVQIAFHDEIDIPRRPAHQRVADRAANERQSMSVLRQGRQLGNGRLAQQALEALPIRSHTHRLRTASSVDP